MRFIGLLLVILLCYSGLWVCTAWCMEKYTHYVRRRGVGIHLGTTYSSVGAYKNQCSMMDISREERSLEWWFLNTIEVIPNEQGHKSSPSCVAFTDSGVLIGEAAKAQAAFNPKRTVCGVARLVGKKFDDPEVQTLIKTLPYEVVNLENKPHVKVNFSNGEAKLFSAEEICAMILGKMKEIAEAYMGREITLAAVIVPSYFDEEMAQHVEDTGKMVGLNMINVFVSRWVAGSVYTRNGRKPRRDAKYFFYELGGSAFDASIQIVDRDEIIASKGDPHLGGDSFDDRVVDHFVNLIKNKYKKDISKDINALTRLILECEKAKISLSSTDQVIVKIDHLADGISIFEEPITRRIFDELNMDLFNRTIDIVKEVMEEGGVEIKDLEDIVLVGGSTHIPKIRRMLMEFFGKEPLDDINPSEASTYDATISAGWLTGECSPDPAGCSFPCVRLNPMSVGIETIAGFMAHIVKYGECLPMKMSRNFTTYHDGQTTVEILVLEGQRPMTKYAHYLGRLEISGIQPAPRGVPTIEVSVEVYEDLRIHVTAQDKATQKAESISISAEQRYIDNYTGKELIRPTPAIYGSGSTVEDVAEMEELKATMVAFPSQAFGRKFAVVSKEDSAGPSAS